MDGGGGNGPPPDCAGSASGSSGSGGREGSQQGENQVQELFGDSNAAIMALVLVVLHILQHAMQDPCTC